MCDLLTAARDLVNKGFYIIPLFPYKKNPKTGNGVKDAQCSQEWVEKHWGKGQQFNIGIACKNIIVIDIDVKSGDGFSDLQQMMKEYGELSSTGKVVTPSGGVHYYFKNPHANINGETHIKFKGRSTQVDIRVDNQYVVAPPSILENGSYGWVNEPFNYESLPELPKAWIDYLPKRKEKPKSLASEHAFEPHWYDSIPIWERHEQCKRYLSKRTFPAIQGQEGQRQMFRMMNIIFNAFAMKPEDAWDILMEYNQKCIPPWTAEDTWPGETAHKAVNTAWSMGDKLRPPKSYSNYPPTKIENKYQPVQEQVDELPKMEIERNDDVDKWSPDYVPKTPGEIDKSEFIDEELLEVPGFISECMTLLEKTSTYYNKYACFTGLLALMATLAGPHFRVHGLYANLYLIALSGSGSGKDAVRNFNKEVLNYCGESTMHGRSFSSGEALEDAIIQRGIKLFQIDECDFLFKTIAQGKESYQRSMQGILLEMYTSVGGVWTRRENSAGARMFSKCEKQIWNPYLTLFGTAPPDHYYDSLSQRVTEGGLFGRIIVVKSPGCKLDQTKDGSFVSDDAFTQIVKMAKFFLEFVANEQEDKNLAGKTGPIMAYDVPISPEALQLFIQYGERAHALSNEPHCSESMKSIYNRAAEKAYKFSLLYELSRKAELLACCRDERDRIDLDQVKNLLEIDTESATWGIKLSQQLVKLQMKDLSTKYYTTDYEKSNNDILALVSEATKVYTFATKDWIYGHCPAVSIAEIETTLNDLIERKLIEYCEFVDKAGNKQRGLRTLKRS